MQQLLRYCRSATRHSSLFSPHTVTRPSDLLTNASKPHAVMCLRRIGLSSLHNTTNKLYSSVTANKLTSELCIGNSKKYNDAWCSSKLFRIKPLTEAAHFKNHYSLVTDLDHAHFYSNYNCSNKSEFLLWLLIAGGFLRVLVDRSPVLAESEDLSREQENTSQSGDTDSLSGMYTLDTDNDEEKWTKDAFESDEGYEALNIISCEMEEDSQDTEGLSNIFDPLPVDDLPITDPVELSEVEGLSQLSAVRQATAVTADAALVSAIRAHRALLAAAQAYTRALEQLLELLKYHQALLKAKVVSEDLMSQLSLAFVPARADVGTWKSRLHEWQLLARVCVQCLQLASFAAYTAQGPDTSICTTAVHLSVLPTLQLQVSEEERRLQQLVVDVMEAEAVVIAHQPAEDAGDDDN